jgi:glycosyltransferase involved in cell wall biosynthesis
MKVLQLSKFFPPVWGGIEATAWELSEGLAREGVCADVLCAHQQLRSTDETTPAGYRVCRAGSLGMLLSTSLSPAMPLMLRGMAACRDLLHVHMPDPMAACAVWLARPRCRLVLHWHSDVVRQRLAMHLYEPLQRWMLARADAIIATSAAYADASRPLRPWRHKVEIIPIGISDNQHFASAETAAAIRLRYGGRKLVFALGRMTYYKGFDVLIEAAVSLPEDCAVLIGGEGDLIDRLRSQIAARGLAGKVHLLGAVADENLPSYFEACDVFCLPSTARSEAYGVAIVEAMLMGRPIVATEIDGSGVPWVNLDGRTGLNVPVGQPAPLARALTRLLDDQSLRRRLGAAARQRYEREFDARLMTQRTLSLYQRLLSNP